MNYYFICEFEELWSNIRDEKSQGGGIHGNGILTRFDVIEARAIKHKYHPYQWDRDGHLKREPRKGERWTLALIIDTPEFGPIECYTVHLEVFCGILGRIAQFSEIFEDARKQHQKRIEQNKPVIPQVILGDLNTMAHSIARLSKDYCTDHLRWRTLGQSEAEWWQENFLDFSDADGEINTNLLKLRRRKDNLNDKANRTLDNSIELLAILSNDADWFLQDEVLRMARNPGFYDPFDLVNDFTLHNKSYCGIYKGKLDWVLLRGLSTVHTKIGNHDFSASDHKWLLVDVVQSDELEKQWRIQRHDRRSAKASKTPFLAVYCDFVHDHC